MNSRTTTSNTLISGLLVSSTFIAHFLTCGFATTLGVFYVEFLTHFKYSSGVTSWVGSINYATMCLVGPVASYISRRYGCPAVIFLGGILSVVGLILTALSPNIFVIFFSLGILTGIGYGLVFNSCIFVINLEITKWRAFCTGLSMSGISLGTTLMPLLSNLLISHYGWRGALLIISGLSLHVIAAAELIWLVQNTAQRANRMLVKVVEHSNDSKLDIKISESNSNALEEKTTSKSIWFNLKYWALQINTLLYCFGQSVVFTHITAFAINTGQSLLQASSFISAVGISCLFGRILLSLASHHPKINTELLFTTSYFSAGICTICYSLWANYTFMLATMVVVGFCMGAYGPLLTEVTYQAVQHDNFSNAYGNIMFISAIGTLLGAPCAGWLYDFTGQYQNSFYLGGASFIASTFPFYVIWFRNKVKNIS